MEPKIKYYKDCNGDLWKKIGKHFWTLRLDPDFAGLDRFYRKWFYWGKGKDTVSFKVIQSKYNLILIDKDQIFVELL